MHHLTLLYPIVVADFWLVVVSPHPLEAIETHGPNSFSYLFFCHSTRRLKQRVNILPHTFHLVASHLKLPPYCMRHRSVGCCTKQPPKTRAPPLSQFFDRFHLGAPNKGIRRSVQEPGCQGPDVDSSGATSPRFGSMADGSMKIKGKAAGG